MAGGLLRSTKALIEQLPAFGGGREGIALPFQFIFTGEDGLKIFVANTVFGQIIRLTGRWLESGSDEVQVFTQDFAHSGAPTEQAFHFGLGRGVLLNMAVLPIGNTCQRGQCYVRVDVERGSGARVVLGTLLAGYIDSSGGRAWPGSPLESAVEGPGFIRTYSSAVPAPAAGAQILLPAATRWRVISAAAILVASAAVMTRRPIFQIVNNALLVCETPSNLLQVAGQSIQHTFAAGLQLAEGTGVICGIGGVPVDCFIQSGGGSDGALTITAFAMDAADQWGAMNVLVEEWRNPITTP